MIPRKCVVTIIAAFITLLLSTNYIAKVVKNIQSNCTSTIRIISLCHLFWLSVFLSVSLSYT
jgi:hypothetical protein